MRSAFFGPLLVSLALHALAGLLLVRLQLAGHEPSSGPELTIGLSALPELNAPTEREPALPTEAAAIAGPDAKPTTADPVTADRPSETAANAPDILATSAPSEKAKAALPAASAAAAEPVRERPADALEAATPTNASSPAASASAAQAAPPVFAPSAVETEAPAAVETAPDTSPPSAPVSPAQPTEVTPSALEAPALAAPASADAPPVAEATGPNSIVETPSVPVQATALPAPAAAKPVEPEAAAVAEAAATDASASKRGPPALLADRPVEIAATTKPPATATGSTAGVAVETKPAAPVDLPPAGQATAAPAETATVAALEPGAVVSSDAADPDEAAQVERARRFIAGYDGGPCVFVAPVRLASGAAEIDDFATTEDEFGAFDRAFMAKAGFESHVTGQIVRVVQCPAIEFLRRLHAGRGVQPMLLLDSPRLGNLGTLTGSVQDSSGRPIQLFLVSQSGVVQDLTSTLSGEGAEHRFAFAAPQRGTEKGEMPELLVAVAGHVKPFTSRDAVAFFDSLGRRAELGTEQVGAAAKLFLLGGD